jgi:hypothetical protein
MCLRKSGGMQRFCELCFDLVMGVLVLESAG